MAKGILTVVMSLLVVAGLIAAPASAGKKAKPKPVTLYLHGATELGEADSMAVVADGFLPMDTTEPSGTTPKSRFITNYLVGPNRQCAANNLFPVWSGPFVGQVKGDVKVTLYAAGTPGQVDIRIWPDVMSQQCTTTNPAAPSDAYVEPSGEVTVDLPPGEGEVTAVLEDVKFKSVSSLMLQVSPTIAADLPDPGGSVLNPFVSRLLYDTPDMAARIELQCVCR